MTKLSPYQTCDRCGAIHLYQWKCQIICPNCGAKLDCSDLFVEHQPPTPPPQSTPLNLNRNPHEK